MARSTWNFYSAGRLVFGPGAVRDLSAICRRHSWRRALIVTDQTLVDGGIVDRVVGALAEASSEAVVFAEGEPEPAVELAVAAADQARQTNPDVILGLGGGSNMDLAKLTAVLQRYGGSPHDYFGFDRVPGPIGPLACLPTTAGTGSEVSHAAVLTDRDSQMKVSTLSPWLRPTAALVDPELTWSCPPKVTADSGIDALTHAIEAITASDFDQLPVSESGAYAYEGRFPISDLLAERAIQLISQNLVAAVHQPDRHQARHNMALAATLAGLAFSNAGVALVHALEYPLGGELHCSHGAGNGLLLPYVMQFNLPERQATCARIASLMGVDTSGLTSEQAAERAIDAVFQLRKQIGIPHRIRDLGGCLEQLPQFAKKSFAIERLRWVNPRQASERDLLSILRSAY